MADVLMRLDEGLGEKVIGLVGNIETEDEDVRAMAALVLGKAEVEIWMKTEDSTRLSKFTIFLADRFRMSTPSRSSHVGEQAGVSESRTGR
jgi:hypothetical protein